MSFLRTLLHDLGGRRFGAPFFCVTFCHNVTSGLPFRSGTTGLFLLHTFARFKEPAEPGRCLRYPPVRRHPLFLASLFATIQHPARPICRDASLIWGVIMGCPFQTSLLGPLKSLNRQQDFFVRTFAHFVQSGSRQALFLVRIFSDYPQSGKSVFLFGFSLRFCIRAAVLFLCDFLRLFQITGPLLYLPHKCGNVSDLVEPAALALICPACVPAVYAGVLGFFRVSPAADLPYLIV